MCGITGCIGSSKNPSISYQLLTKLLEKSESRGIDAAGVWATQSGINGKVIYHKEPIRASKFVKNKVWKKILNYNPDLVLAHARGASKGMGEPFFNENNHPFTSTDKTIGLIHNGKIESLEYNLLKQKYELNSDCDSELLLRVFESNLKNEEDDYSVIPKQIISIKNIYSLINEGHMAVAIGERVDNGNRLLWLFRNKHRPLWIVDERDYLGQIFFVSEPSIWEDAQVGCGVKLGSNYSKFIEVLPEEIWSFTLNNKEIFSDKYKIEKQELMNWEDNKYFNIIKKQPYFDLITKLNEKEQVVK